MDDLDRPPGGRRAGAPRSWPGAPEGERHGADLVRLLGTMPAACCFLDRQWRFRCANAEAERSVVDLAPATTVLLYTDGLIERRGSTLDEGLARLTGQLRELAGSPLDRLCDAVLERMPEGTPQDDVALVAVRISPTDPA